MSKFPITLVQDFLRSGTSDLVPVRVFSSEIHSGPPQQSRPLGHALGDLLGTILTVEPVEPVVRGAGLPAGQAPLFPAESDCAEVLL